VPQFECNVNHRISFEKFCVKLLQFECNVNYRISLKKSVLRPIPARQFSLDAGASTSAVQSESLGLGSAVSRSACRPGFTGRVYQRWKRWNQRSSAVWRVKTGQPILDEGTSQVREKEAVSSKIGDQDTSPAFEVVLGGGAGVPKVLQLADRQSEESLVSFPGLDSDGLRQSGFDSMAASETSDPGERGTVVGNEISLALSAEGGGLLVTPQVRTSQLCVGMGSSGFGVDSVTQRQGEGSLELVMFSAKEGEVGIVSEAILGGPLMENCLWKGLGDKMESGSSFECVVAEKCDHFDCSSMLLEHNHEGLLLQDKSRDGEGELESYEPLVIAPLVVEGVERQSVT